MATLCVLRQVKWGPKATPEQLKRAGDHIPGQIGVGPTADGISAKVQIYRIAALVLKSSRGIELYDERSGICYGYFDAEGNWHKDLGRSQES